MSVSTVKVNINGTDYPLAYNGTSGKWEGTVTAPVITSFNQSGGHYSCTVTATDNAGNTATKNDSDATLGAALQLVVKETTKPTISSIIPSTGAKLTTSTPTITFSLRDEVNGSGIKISSLALKIDGGASVGNASAGVTCTAVTNGYDCSYVPQAAIAEGSHTITIDIQDNDGNAAIQSSTTFTVDTVPPTLNVISPTAAQVTNNASLTVSGTTNDATTSPVTVTIKLNGVDQGLVTVNAGAFSKAITLAQGDNTVIIRSTDGAGKFSEITRTITLDTTPPVISAVSFVPNPVNGGQTITISVMVSD